MRLPVPLLACLASCARGSALPTPEFGAAMQPDPLIRERIEEALAEARGREPGALLELAKTYHANGLGELAAETYRLCLVRGDAGNEPARVHHLIGASLEGTARADEALAAFETARAAAPEYAPAHWRAGNLLLDAGRAAEARAAFERALALEPDGVPQSLGLARVELADGRPEAARSRLEALAARWPRERLVHGLLARARRACGDTDGASAALDVEARADESKWNDPWTAEALRRATGVSAAIQRANDLLVAGDPRGAIVVLEPVCARVPECLPAVQLLIKAYLDARGEAGALERAAALLADARQRFPGQFKLEYYAGLLALEGRQLRAAKQALERSLALSPRFGPTLAALGECELARGDLAAAERAYDRAAEQGADDLRTRVLHGQVKVQLGKHDEAIALLEAASAGFERSAVPRAHLAEALARVGRVEEARRVLDEAERLDPAFGYIHKVRVLLDERVATAPGE